MVTHITARPPGATEDLTLQVTDISSEVVILAVAESKRAGSFDTTLDGQPVITRSPTPFYDSCRVLEAFGYTGRVQFVDAVTGARRMSMLITHGAKLSVEDGPSGPKVRKYRLADRGGDAASGRNADVLTIGKVEASANG